MRIFNRSWFPKWKDLNDDVWQALWRSAVAEFFGTALFIFLGCGSVVATQDTLGRSVGASGIETPSLTVIALAHGFAITVIIYAIGEISGGHINPAVTWATLVTNRVSILRALVYWLAQILGAIVGAGILAAIIPVEMQYSLGCHGINPELGVARGYFAEVVFTFIFIFIVFATAISPFVGKIAPLAGGGNDYGPGKLTPLALGLTILVLHTVGIPLTGASMNPARSFGPAVVHGCWQNQWVYWVAPLTGSTIAAFLTTAIFLTNPNSLYAIFSLNRGQNPQANELVVQKPGEPGFAELREDISSSATTPTTTFQQ